MAIDSTAKRYSLLGLLTVDGEVDASDRLTLLGLYGGVEASEPAEEVTATGLLSLWVGSARYPSIVVGSAQRPSIVVGQARYPTITVD